MFLALSAVVALSNAYANVATLGVEGDEVPDAAELGPLVLELTSISGATTVTWYVSRDAAGDVPITPPQTDTILTGKTAATKGSVARDMDATYKRHPDTTQGRLYVWAKLDSGTANMSASLTGSTP
jgi:hypothetical protein